LGQTSASHKCPIVSGAISHDPWKVPPRVRRRFLAEHVVWQTPIHRSLAQKSQSKASMGSQKRQWCVVHDQEFWGPNIFRTSRLDHLALSV
jgi:hypothetical protein